MTEANAKKEITKKGLYLQQFYTQIASIIEYNLKTDKIAIGDIVTTLEILKGGLIDSRKRTLLNLKNGIQKTTVRNRSRSRS